MKSKFYCIFLMLTSWLQIPVNGQNLPKGIAKAWSDNAPNGIIRCEKNSGDKTYYGYYTREGKEILPCIYDNVWGDKKSATLEKDGKYGFFSFVSKKKLNPEYCIQIDFYRYNYSTLVIGGIVQKDSIHHPSFGKYNVTGGKWGLCDMNANIVIPCEYDFCDAINRDENFWYVNNGAKVTNGIVEGGKWGIYSSKGTLLVPPKYDGCYVLSDGYYCVNKGGYVKSGQYFTEMTPQTGKWGVANGETLVVPVEFDEIKIGEQKYKGEVFFWTKKNDKWGAYAIKTEIMPTIYDGNAYLGEDVFAVKKDNKWALYGDGRLLTAFQYDYIQTFSNGVAMMKLDGEQKLVKNPLKDASSIVIAEGMSGKKRREGPVQSRYPAPNSDVDKNIPVSSKKDENTFAFIIANENYDDAPVPYSLNDGRMFAEYCKKTLGLPEKNVNLYEDATYGNIVIAMEKIKNIADTYDGNAKIIIYYSGHGYPDPSTQEAYMLPIDGNASDISTTGYSLKKLYKELNSMNIQSSLVILDACFSGTQRDDAMLAQSRGVAIKVKQEVPEGKVVVFSASQGDETAHQLEEKGHGLFTYYLLKQLQMSNGESSIGEMSDYVTKMVKRQSVVINNKKQTPTISAPSSQGEDWKNLKLKN